LVGLGFDSWPAAKLCAGGLTVLAANAGYNVSPVGGVMVQRAAKLVSGRWRRQRASGFAMCFTTAGGCHSGLHLSQSRAAWWRGIYSVSAVCAPPKRLLTVTEAATYCGMGAGSFAAHCPVRPKRVRPGLRGLRWTCAISTAGLTASRQTANLCPHLLTNGSSVWMPLIKVRGVKAYVSKGQVYAYHRATSTRLKSLYGSHDFFVELKAIEDKHKATPKEAKPPTAPQRRSLIERRDSTRRSSGLALRSSVLLE